MKLRRAIPSGESDISSAGYWASADGRWGICRYIRTSESPAGWRIHSRRGSATDDYSQYRKDVLFLRSLGLDCTFKTRRETVAALERALEGLPS